MTPKDRALVYEASDKRCHYCGEELNGVYHLDHFLPIHRRKNGCKYPERDCIENMVVACVRCNIAKKQKSIEGFRRLLQRKLIQLNKLANFSLAKKYRQLVETPVLR